MSEEKRRFVIAIYKSSGVYSGDMMSGKGWEKRN
jgi:hypothetical protein